MQGYEAGGGLCGGRAQGLPEDPKGTEDQGEKHSPREMSATRATGPAALHLTFSTPRPCRGPAAAPRPPLCSHESAVECWPTQPGFAR